MTVEHGDRDRARLDVWVTLSCLLIRKRKFWFQTGFLLFLTVRVCSVWLEAVGRSRVT